MTNEVAKKHFREHRTPVRQENMDYEKSLSVSYNPAMQGREEGYTSFPLPHWGAALPAFFYDADLKEGI